MSSAPAVTRPLRSMAHDGLMAGLMGRQSRVALVALSTAIVGIVFAATPWGASLEEDFGLDLLFAARGPVAPPDTVAIVAFNRDTARELGLSRRPWQWSRAWHGRVIDEVTARGAEVVVVDISFEARRDPVQDGALAAALARSQRVVLFERLESVRRPFTDADGETKAWIVAEQLRSPIPEVLESALGYAPFPLPKLGPTVRTFWTFTPGLDAPTLPAVALQALTLDHLDAWAALLSAAGAHEASMVPRTRSEIGSAIELRATMLRLRDLFSHDPALADRMAHHLESGTEPKVTALSVAQQQQLLALARLYQDDDLHYLNFYGPPGTIATLPYHELLGARTGEPPSGPSGDVDLAGKVVFIGSSDLFDPEQQDRFSTVFTRADGVDLSGVEIAATAYANLVTRASIERLSGVQGAALLGMFGGAVGAATSALSVSLAGPAVAALALVYVAVAYEAFVFAHRWLPLTSPLLVQVPFALLIGLLGQYLISQRERRQARRAVGYFLPEGAIRQIADRGMHPLAINRETYAVCLATDVGRFTSIAEALRPQALTELMNEYFEVLAEVMQAHGADICEFYADSIMATWTSAASRRDLHRRASVAALEARDMIDRFNTRHLANSLPTRIGLHAGTVSLGAAGGGGRFVYGVRGDAANVASRIEQLNKRLGTKLLASTSVTDDAADLLLRACGDFRLLGKTEVVTIGEIMARKDEADAQTVTLVARFATAMAAFQQQEWSAAAELFKAILDDYPGDGPARFYLSCSRLYELAPPPREAATVIRMGAK